MSHNYHAYSNHENGGGYGATIDNDRFFCTQRSVTLQQPTVKTTTIDYSDNDRLRCNNQRSKPQPSITATTIGYVATTNDQSHNDRALRLQPSITATTVVFFTQRTLIIATRVVFFTPPTFSVATVECIEDNDRNFYQRSSALRITMAILGIFVAFGVQ